MDTLVPKGKRCARKCLQGLFDTTKYCVFPIFKTVSYSILNIYMMIVYYVTVKSRVYGTADLISRSGGKDSYIFGA